MTLIAIPKNTTGKIINTHSGCLKKIKEVTEIENIITKHLQGFKTTTK